MCIYLFVVLDVRYLVSQGCIRPLCDLLVCPDPIIVTVCLEGLENILKVGEAEKNAGHTKGMNVFAQLIDSSRTFDFIVDSISSVLQIFLEFLVDVLGF
ncbi:hypothetical protein IFM89_003187 [Coptis chinensis]|uniref:Uncharacterized protein n=1 Tax=Coptis chinensis TaxID=261450 RepID=A0A835LL21_9MAGN|nr:hypothetical protein IFM89_003187 [Coptis chinensis]